MKPHEINQLATWLPMNTDELSIKAFGAGYPYTSKGIVVRSSMDKPVVRYAKNYDLKGKRYSLCLISTETDTNKIEEWLDERSKKITKKHLTNGFNMLKAKYERN